MDNIRPTLDVELLQKKVDEYAFKGAKEAFEEFYTGYASPYKKAIEENLKNKGVNVNFDIPDIIAVLNEKISSEIDIIANTAVSKTFIPLIKEFLIRENSNIKFSDILETFIKYTEFNYDENNIEDYVVEKIDIHNDISLNNRFPVYRITNGKKGFELHFSKNRESNTIMSLPYILNDNGKYNTRTNIKETMKLSLDGGVTLELPFVKGILEDSFMKYCAKLIIGNNHIEFDVTDFDDDMFPEDDECYCH